MIKRSPGCNCCDGDCLPCSESDLYAEVVISGMAGTCGPGSEDCTELDGTYELDLDAIPSVQCQFRYEFTASPGCTSTASDMILKLSENTTTGKWQVELTWLENTINSVDFRGDLASDYESDASLAKNSVDCLTEVDALSLSAGPNHSPACDYSSATITASILQN